MIIKNERLLKKLYENGIVEKKHSILRSGKHSDTYIRKTKITLYPKLYKEIIYELGGEIGYQFKNHDYDIITGPAVAGLCFASPLSFLLDKPLIFPEKNFYSVEGDINYKNKYNMEFRPEYRDLYNKRVIIIEDIITTGGSVAKTAQAIAKYGGIPVAVFCIWKRNLNIHHITYRIKENIPIFSIPVYSLINERVSDWEPENCPICNPEPSVNHYGKNT